MKKTKLIISIVLTTILTTSALLAWVDLWTVNSWDTLTSTLWNSLVWKVNENGNKLNWIYNVWWKIWIWTVNPVESLDVTWNIKITWNWKSVTITTDSWNEVLKNMNKGWYVYTTYNSVDWRHHTYWPGTNFRNCEVVQYFQEGETIQNTDVYTIRAYLLWGNRTLWSSNVNHAKFLRDFTLNPTRSDPNSVLYASWVITKYWPSILQRCAID
jgi:hypothetical protein